MAELAPSYDRDPLKQIFPPMSALCGCIRRRPALSCSAPPRGCPLVLDGEGRVRLDTWELNHAVQDAVAERWSAATTDIPWPAAN